MCCRLLIYQVNASHKRPQAVDEQSLDSLALTSDLMGTAIGQSLNPSWKKDRRSHLVFLTTPGESRSEIAGSCIGGHLRHGL